MTSREILDMMRRKMHDSVETFRQDITKIRTGKASPALLENIKVDYYGVMTPLNQVASIGTPEPRLLTVQPWEKSMIPVIEKAILAANIGLTPNSDGTIIRLAVPQLTEDRRKELVKMVKKMAEDARVALRNVRRDGNDEFKKAEKNKDISEDEMHKGQNDIQKILDEHTKLIDEILSKKEAEIMEV
ncbi:MAG: ribosome recycling factor [Gemmatimonadetes bacterium]|nr:MAG: ribosome recycling factor [Gemmatimonadota bacterium]